MEILALRVESRRPHPGADALDLYELAAPGREAIVIVGNRDHVYEEGDRVAVALDGAVLADGTVIKRRKLRGIVSAGMILEPVDEEPGACLRERFGREPEPEPEPAPAPSDSEKPSAPQDLRKRGICWPHVEQLHQMRSELLARRRAGFVSESARWLYRAKVKLHGTNAGVQVHPDGRVVAQGRNYVLGEPSEAMGFCGWVAEHAASFAELARPEEVVVVHGEWAGPGVQKDVATCQLPEKIFAVFAVQQGHHEQQEATLVFQPDELVALLPAIDRMHVLPWHGDAFELSFGDDAQLGAAAEWINEQVEAIETEDPFIRERFGVEGVGEGLVGYPVAELVSDGERALGAVSRDLLDRHLFKAKGVLHRGVKQRKPALAEPQ
ncbi:MAG: RNA ligase family protein, partial [Acidobacteriota bacterium]